MRMGTSCLLAITLACGAGGGETGPTAGTGVAGRYTLRTVNGQGLPATVVMATSARITFIAAEFTLTASGGYSGVLDTRTEVTGLAPQQARTTSSGSYRISGQSIVVTQVSETNGARSPEVTQSGVIAGDGSIQFEGPDRTTYVYRR